MNIWDTIKLRIKDFFESNNLKKFYKAIFIIMVFSQIFFAATTFNETSPFSFGERWIAFIRNYAGFLVILFCLLTKKFTTLELKWYFLIAVFIMFYTYIRYFRWTAIYFLATAMVVKDEKDHWIAGSLFWTYLVNFILVLSLTYLGLIETFFHGRPDFMRSSLGFTHPNMTGAMVLAIFIAYLLKKKENPSLYILASFVPIFIILNQFIGSRTGLIIIIFMLTCIILLKLCEKWQVKLDFLNKYKVFLISGLPFLFLFGSYFLSYFFINESNIFLFLNQLVTWRIGMGSLFIQEYPLTLWGVQIYQNARDPASIAEYGYRFLDNGFLLSLLAVGLIYTLLRLLYCSWLGNKMTARGYKYMPIILIGFLLFGFMEQIIWDPRWNILFLFGGVLLKEQGMKYRQ